MRPYNHLILCWPLLLVPSISASISRPFPMSRLFTDIRRPNYWTSASASVPPMNIQDWFPLGLTGLIPLLFKGFSRVFSSTTVWRRQFFSTQLSLWSNSHIHHDYWKNHSFDYMDLCWQRNGSALNMLSRFVIAFLPRNQHLLISWLQSPSIVILDLFAQANKICHRFQFFPNYLPWNDETSCHDLCFLNVEF